MPVVLDSGAWAEIESGIIERAELLDLVLTDLYGPRELLRRHLIPPEVVLGHPGFLHACDGIRLPGEHQLFNYAADLGRCEDGRLVVLADRTQAPSGSGYAMENRLVCQRVLPTLYRDAGVHRLAPFFRWLRSALQAAAPPDVEDPRIVVLSPGPYNETAFEHAVLASTLGYPLVEGSDLTVRGGSVWMRSLGQREPVHVILRRRRRHLLRPARAQPGVPARGDRPRAGDACGHGVGGQRARVRRAREPGARGLRGGRRPRICSAARCACPRCRAGGAATRWRARTSSSTSPSSCCGPRRRSAATGRCSAGRRPPPSWRRSAPASRPGPPAGSARRPRRPRARRR